MVEIKVDSLLESTLLVLQLTPALTDYKGSTIFICYRRISVITDMENEEFFFKGLKNAFRHRRISITGGSVMA